MPANEQISQCLDYLYDMKQSNANDDLVKLVYRNLGQAQTAEAIMHFFNN